jgi:hypothetical protein
MFNNNQLISEPEMQPIGFGISDAVVPFMPKEPPMIFTE